MSLYTLLWKEFLMPTYLFLSCCYSYLLALYYIFLFFFSSRRRHTRYIGDWSSDVCSSDLDNFSITSSGNNYFSTFSEQTGTPVGIVDTTMTITDSDAGQLMKSANVSLNNFRSEERRVGKECRSRWSKYH